jgi:hypothetical protein
MATMRQAEIYKVKYWIPTPAPKGQYRTLYVCDATMEGPDTDIEYPPWTEILKTADRYLENNYREATLTGVKKLEDDTIIVFGSFLEKPEDDQTEPTP